MTSFYWQTGNFYGRCRASAPASSSSVYLPSWDQYSLAIFSAGAVTAQTTAGPAPASSSVRASGSGYLAACSDSAYNLYAAAGTFLFATGGSIGGPINVPLTTGKFFNTCACTPAGKVIVVAVDGTVIEFASASAVVSGTYTTHGTLSYFAASTAVDAVNMYAVRAGNGDVAAYNLATRAVTSLGTATGMPIPSAATTSAAVTGVAVCGWAYATIASGATCVVQSPMTPTTAAVVYTGNKVGVITGTDPYWTVGAVLSSVTGAKVGAWTPSGTQLLVGGTGSTYVLLLSSGSFSIAQTFSGVTGVTALATTSDGAAALAVAGTTAYGFADSAGVWSTAGTVTLGSSGVAVVMLSPTEAAIPCTNGTIYILARSGTTWSVSTSYTTSFSAIASAVLDPVTANLVVVGVASGSGSIQILAPTTGVSAGSASWTGNAVSVAAVNRQYVVLDTTSSLVRFFPAIPTLLSRGGTQAPPSGTASVWGLTASLWMLSATAATPAWSPVPFAYQVVKSGVVALYVGGAWGTAYVLGPGHDPSAVAWNAAGTEVDVVTVQNDFYRFSVSGNALSLSSQAVVGDYTGQLSGVTMGMSSALWVGSHLYATTADSGVFVQLV